MPDYYDVQVRKDRAEADARRSAGAPPKSEGQLRQEADRHRKEIVNPGPGERLAGKLVLTQPQQEMRAKREAARAEDLKVARREIKPQKSHPELPKQNPSR